MSREIIFYTTENGHVPLKDFLDSIDISAFQKIAWTLQLIKQTVRIPKKYFKKLIDTDDIWEVRIKVASDIFRIFCFWDKGNLIVLTHGIQKKTQKTSAKDIKLAEKYRQDYFRRKL